MSNDAAVQAALTGTAFLSDIRVWAPELKTASRRWLKNFMEDERVYAAALLEAFMYFSTPLIDRMFVAAFDSLAVEIVETATTYASKKDAWRDFLDEVLVTHPTGEMPNVTDSGYGFDRKARQKLEIHESHILQPEGVIDRLVQGPPAPVVFVDDFVGSGDQFRKTWHREYEIEGKPMSFAAIADQVSTPFYYCPLVCSELGAVVIERECHGLLLRPTHLLPAEYSANHAQSLVWPDSIRAHAVSFVEAVSDRAGIPPHQSWGYADLGYSLAFEHGVPDATLPIFWWEENGWLPLVRRR